MVTFGKQVKGKATETFEQKRVLIKIQHQDKSMEDFDKE